MKNQIQKIIQEYKSLSIQQQLDYDKFYLYSIITHSTAIEGSTVTEIENQLLFDEGISANKPMHEQLMNMIQYEAGLIPSIIKKEKRAEYISSLSQSQDEESSAKFIDFMMEHHCENLGINPSAVQKHIEKLKKENAIKRSGGDKGGWWEIL